MKKNIIEGAALLRKEYVRPSLKVRFVEPFVMMAASMGLDSESSSDAENSDAKVFNIWKYMED